MTKVPRMELAIGFSFFTNKMGLLSLGLLRLLLT